LLALIAEKSGSFTTAMEGYMQCMNHCSITASEFEGRMSRGPDNLDAVTLKTLAFLKELKGEAMLRIAILKKEMSAYDQSMETCNNIISENFGRKINSNAICLKVDFSLLSLSEVCRYTYCSLGTHSRDSK